MCGLFGVIRYGDNSEVDLVDLVESLGIAAATRGTDATGISYIKKGKMVVSKGGVSAYQFKFNMYKKARVVMGHTRATTQGSEKNNYNNHPFTGKVGKQYFTLAHNGILSNDKELRRQYGISKTEIDTDSYIAVQLIEHFGRFDMSALKFMGENVEGMYSFTLLDSKNNWYLIKNDSPLKIIHFPELKMYAYASTEKILFDGLINSELEEEITNTFKTGVIKTEFLEPKAGEIWKIDSSNGHITIDTFKPTERYSYSYSYNYIESYYKNYDDYELNSTLIPDSEHINNIINLAENSGFNKADVKILTSMGYDLEEIEDALLSGYFDIILDEAGQVLNRSKVSSIPF